jgi:hypothetical protein
LEDPQAMSFQQLLDYQFPEFTVTVGSILLGIYFLGVAISAFRLIDRLWLIHQFLNENGNGSAKMKSWQAMPTALMSGLLLSWEKMGDEKRQAWAAHWLPIHPIYGWEAILVELLVVLNWWNPLLYRYRAHWAALFDGWQEKPYYPTAPFSWKGLGFIGLAAGLYAGFYSMAKPDSPFNWVNAKADLVIEKTVFDHKTNKPHDYQVEWGSIKIPLKKFANPNGYSAELEVELADFKQVIKKPLKVYKDGFPLTPGVLSILYKSNQTGTQAYINGIDPKKVKLLDRQKKLIFNDSLGLGDELVLFGDAEDIYLSRVEIRIKDPEAGFEPRYFVPQLSDLEATMPYQIVARRGQRALVKIDPESPKAAHFLELYKDEKQYEIVLLPGFRTNRHYLTEAESLASKVAAANTTLTYQEKDAYYLPEFQAYQGKDVRLVWGKMEASPSNTNYPLDSFLLSIDAEPKLLVGEDTLDLISFQLIIAGKNTPARCFETYRTGELVLKPVIEKVQDETSIFFDKIVVRDQQDERRLFPASFAFNIGEPSKYKRSWEPSRNFLLYKGAKPDVVEVMPLKTQNQIDSTVNEMKKRMNKGNIKK